MLKIAHILMILLAASVMHGCSRNTYQDRTMLCRGSIVSWTGGRSLYLGDSSKIGLRIENDVVSTSGNGMISVDSIKGCQPNENQYSKKDHLFFDSSGCRSSEAPTKRTYGSFDYLTKELQISQHFDHLEWVDGKFKCDKIEP